VDGKKLLNADNAVTFEGGIVGLSEIHSPQQFMLLCYKERPSAETQDERQQLQMTNTSQSNALVKTVIQSLSLGYFTLNVDWSLSLRSNGPSNERHFQVRLFEERTPTQLFGKFVETQQYEEALKVARQYHLSTDLLYQSWSIHAPVSDEMLKVSKENGDGNGRRDG
jgi:hypothetical protein